MIWRGTLSVIAIIDFSSQFKQLIAKQIREMGVYCEKFPSNINFVVSKYNGIIFSGGPQSVNDSYSLVSEVADEIIKFTKVS